MGGVVREKDIRRPVLIAPTADIDLFHLLFLCSASLERFQLEPRSGQLLVGKTGLPELEEVTSGGSGFTQAKPWQFPCRRLELFVVPQCEPAAILRVRFERISGLCRTRFGRVVIACGIL